jgi:hypothetical protein
MGSPPRLDLINGMLLERNVFSNDDWREAVKTALHERDAEIKRLRDVVERISKT